MTDLSIDLMMARPKDMKDHQLDTWIQ